MIFLPFLLIGLAATAAAVGYARLQADRAPASAAATQSMAGIGGGAAAGRTAAATDGGIGGFARAVAGGNFPGRGPGKGLADTPSAPGRAETAFSARRAEDIIGAPLPAVVPIHEPPKQTIPSQPTIIAPPTAGEAPTATVGIEAPTTTAPIYEPVYSPPAYSEPVYTPPPVYSGPLTPPNVLVNPYSGPLTPPNPYTAPTKVTTVRRGAFTPT